MSSFFQGTDPDVDTGGAAASAQLAKDWAIKLDGPVQGTDYSAQIHAQRAAQASQVAVDSALAADVSAQEAIAAADALNNITLDDIVDVNAPTPNDGDRLTWVAANSRWEPRP
jgi:ribosomal protein S11